MKENIDLTDFLKLKPELQARFKVQDVARLHRVAETYIQYKRLLLKDPEDENLPIIYNNILQDVQELQRTLKIGSCSYKDLNFPELNIHNQEHELFGELYHIEEPKFS